MRAITILGSLFSGVILTAAAHADQKDFIYLKNLIQQWDVLSNLQIVATAEVKEYNGQSKDFTTLLNAATTTTLIDNRSSRLRIIYSPAKDLWKNGKAPFFIENKTIAYNGKYWINAVVSQGPENSTYLYERATITEKSPFNPMFPRWETGEMFTLPFSSVFNELPMKSTLIDASKLYINVGSESINGEVYTKIVVADAETGSSRKETFWLSKSHPGALAKRKTELGISYRDSKPGIEFDYQVDDWEKISDQLFFPTMASRTTFINGIPDNKVIFKLKSITKDLPTSKIRFDPEITSGWHIEDTRYGSSFVVGDSPSTIVDKIKTTGSAE